MQFFFFNMINFTWEHQESGILQTKTTTNHNWNNADMYCGFLEHALSLKLVKKQTHVMDFYWNELQMINNIYSLQ